jgi:hypothetical protein
MYRFAENDWFPATRLHAASEDRNTARREDRMGQLTLLNEVLLLPYQKLSTIRLHYDQLAGGCGLIPRGGKSGFSR